MTSEGKPKAQTARGGAGRRTLERLKQEQAASCLNCVLHSKTFSASDSIRHILKFIVEKSLAGSVGDIKEYTIATEAWAGPRILIPRQTTSYACKCNDCAGARRVLVITKGRITQFEL